MRSNRLLSSLLLGGVIAAQPGCKTAPDQPPSDVARVFDQAPIPKTSVSDENRQILDFKDYSEILEKLDNKNLLNVVIWGLDQTCQGKQLPPNFIVALIIIISDRTQSYPEFVTKEINYRFRKREKAYEDERNILKIATDQIKSDQPQKDSATIDSRTQNNVLNTTLCDAAALIGMENMIEMMLWGTGESARKFVKMDWEAASAYYTSHPTEDLITELFGDRLPAGLSRAQATLILDSLIRELAANEFFNADEPSDKHLEPYELARKRQMQSLATAATEIPQVDFPTHKQVASPSAGAFYQLLQQPRLK